MIGNRKYQKKSKKGNSQNNRNQKRNQNRSKNNRNNQNRNNQNRNQRMNNMNQNRSVTQTKKRSSAKAKRKNRSRRRSMTASQKKRLMANLNRQMNRKKVRKSANKNQRRKRYSKQRGGFMAGLGGPADVPQFCDAQGHAVADLLGAKAANAVRAAGGNEEAQEAAAQNVINVLRTLADDGLSVITTLHQPRVTIMNKFDLLMIISSGKSIYYGSIADYIPYIENHLNIKIPEHES